MESFPWYALQVRPRFEKQIATTLLSKGYEGFLPLYRHRSRWSDRIKEVELPLFSGYMFCRFDVNKRLPILVTPGVIQVVGIGKTPHPVDDEEIVALQAIVISGLQTEPRSYLTVGRKVRIEIGPLAGVEGIVTTLKGANRLVVSVSLLQRSVSVEIDESWVLPVTAAVPVLQKPEKHSIVNRQSTIVNPA
ncbi:MAG TPA: UpxY family transcription antiterminator [Acidobacteriota bacterium]|nr:UpxY family transcription antiterminator [Acidobacteriota bacterium]